MRHDINCTKRDGDWICSAACRVDEEERRQAERAEILAHVEELETQLSKALVAAETLRSLAGLVTRTKLEAVRMEERARCVAEIEAVAVPDYWTDGATWGARKMKEMIIAALNK